MARTITIEVPLDERIYLMVACGRWEEAGAIAAKIEDEGMRIQWVQALITAALQAPRPRGEKDEEG